MKIDRVKITRNEDGEPIGTVTIAFMEYEVQEMANQERERIERGLPVGEARIAIDRFTTFRLALNMIRQAKQEPENA
jgi:Ribonuclease G/E